MSCKEQNSQAFAFDDYYYHGQEVGHSYSVKVHANMYSPINRSAIHDAIGGGNSGITPPPQHFCWTMVARKD